MNLIKNNLIRKFSQAPGISPDVPDNVVISLIERSQYSYLLDKNNYERIFIPKNVPQGTDGRFGHANTKIFLTEIYAFKNLETEKFECIVITIEFDTEKKKIKIPTYVDIQHLDGKPNDVASKVFGSNWVIDSGDNITYDGYLYEDASNKI